LDGGGQRVLIGEVTDQPTQVATRFEPPEELVDAVKLDLLLVGGGRWCGPLAAVEQEKGKQG
jgi:hypothetical protein